ncbi:MAG: patatin-like phospholipase family protein [Ferruginibacter sp.]
MKILLLLLLIPSLCIAQQKPNYTNLALEGGGVRGLAYAGVFSVLEKKGVLQQIDKVAGTSAGAIAGLLLSVGYSAKEIDSIMQDLPVQEFNDGKGGLIGKYERVKHDFGIYEGKKFDRWLQQLVNIKTGKPGLTFAELHQLHLTNNLFKDLYCTGTNLSRQQLEIFSYEHTPNMPIALAVRISGTVPLYFEPVALDNNKKMIQKGDTSSFINYYVDGGMLCNYPINMFDTCNNNENPLMYNNVKFNRHTIGIKLERPEQIDSLQKNNVTIPPFSVNNFNQYLSAFTNLMMETLNRRYPNLENEIGRTIYVSYGTIHAKIRKMKNEEKQMLFDNGVKAATAFLNTPN